MVQFRHIAAGLGLLAAAALSGQSAEAAPVVHHPLQVAYHAHGRDSDELDLPARAGRSRDLSPLDLGQLMNGPPLNPPAPLVTLPGMGPPPHSCGIGQYRVNGSCL